MFASIKKLSILLIFSNFLFPVAYAAYSSQYQEEAAIMKVAKQSVPAVVNILISQDIAKPSCSSQPSTQEQTNSQQVSMEEGPASSKNPCAQPFVPFDKRNFLYGATGFIISPAGYILTDDHVVDFPEVHYTVFLSDGRPFDGKIVAQDAQHDLAVVKIEADDLPSLSFAPSAELGLGQTVVSIGNALVQFPNSVTHGVVSGLERGLKVVTDKIEKGEIVEDSKNAKKLTHLIQIDAPVNSGNSGGPLLDLNGKVVGIIEANIPNISGIAFATRSEATSEIFAELQKKGVNLLKPLTQKLKFTANRNKPEILSSRNKRVERK